MTFLGVTLDSLLDILLAHLRHLLEYQLSRTAAETELFPLVLPSASLAFYLFIITMWGI